MKFQMNLKKKLSVAFSALVLIALSSCGKIPSAYQGTYVDQPSGAKLVLDSSKGKLTETSGREISAEADSLQFDSLIQGKAGLYMIPVPENQRMTELVWIVPDVASRQEYPNVVVWFKAELLVTRILNDAKEQVPSITAEHCMDGMVTLDLQTKTFIKGCHATAVPKTFTRVKQ